MGKIYLLFTGGWDSTFRLLQLATEQICIQPIYLIDKNRGGTEYENIAMDKIIDIIKTNGEKYNFKAEILDIKYLTVDWILDTCQDPEISAAFKYLNDKYAIGTQYEWFALLTKYLGIEMEVGVVHQYHGKVENAIEAEGKLELIPNDILPDRYHVLSKPGATEIISIFGNLIFPIIKLTKEDEESIANKNNWTDIMKLTWFCHSPIRGKPCGLCSPCEDAMNTGMEWRMPKSAQRRYKYRSIYRFMKRVRRRLGRIKSRIINVSRV